MYEITFTVESTIDGSPLQCHINAQFDNPPAPYGNEVAKKFAELFGTERVVSNISVKPI